MTQEQIINKCENFLFKCKDLLLYYELSQAPTIHFFLKGKRDCWFS